MFENAAIDVAIGLILMYLVLSLLCTVVNEFIATKLSLRSSTLKDALDKLIDNPDLLARFRTHGLIALNTVASATGSQSTYQAVKSLAPTAPDAPAAGNVAPVKDEHPSYLASGTVALALMGSLLKQVAAAPNAGAPVPNPGAAAPTPLQSIEGAIDALPEGSKLKDALKASVLQANGDIDALRKSIATWFDDSMDRLSGAYKRKMKWIAMLIGLLVAIAFNADSFSVATTLWNDADRRASTVAIATQIAAKPLPGAGQPVDQKTLGDEVKATEATLRSLPIGWNCTAKTAGEWTNYWTCVTQDVPKNLSLVKFLGWLLTAAALSLGAPFWFDLLNKFINLRGAGEKPKRNDQK